MAVADGSQTAIITGGSDAAILADPSLRRIRRYCSRTVGWV
jgi:hypothetical protein